MSLLAPLYFLGAFAISLPIIFHLIRRQPKGEVSFSSLMFLRPTPPRLTRRSRLENWPLLILRALILTLMAAAFTRPLFRGAERAETPQTRRVTVLLVDTSASMKRVGLWKQALATADTVIEELKRGDQLAVIGFDRRPVTLISFEQSSRTNFELLKAAAKSALTHASPSWNRTDLGHAIRYAAELATSRDKESGDESIRIVLVSDMQQAGDLESLQAYSWPNDLFLDLRRVIAKETTNASVTFLPESNLEFNDGKQLRVRVVNSPNATAASFQLGWTTIDGTIDSLPIQVPPGQSRVIRLPQPDTDARLLNLTGDDDDFDNQRFYVVPESRELTLLFLGPEVREPHDSLVHFLQRAPLGDRFRTVTAKSIRVEAFSETPAIDQTPLVVIDDAPSVEGVKHLVEYLTDGGRLLVVLSDTVRADDVIGGCNAITDSELTVSEAKIDDYAMLSKIDFNNSIFVPMSKAPYNDFSKIRFWSHRTLAGLTDDWSVVASFDDGDPALVETTIGDGKLWILTAGWQPSASQLALSTKFVPLIFQFVDSREMETRSSDLTIGDPIPFAPSSTATITMPAGESFDYRDSDDFAEIALPGIYRWSDGDQTAEFAVNLDPTESRTQPIDDDVLRQLGVKLGSGQTTEFAEKHRRRLLDRELEGRQRIWQWLLVIALGLLGLETWLGGRAHEPSIA